MTVVPVTPAADPTASAGPGPGATEPRPAEPQVRAPLARFWRRFLRQPAAVASLGFLVLVTLAAAAAPLLATHDPNASALGDRLAGLGGEHLLGADDLGRDVFSRLLFAGRTSLLAGLQATLIAFVLGVPTGLVAGYVGGWVDRVASRVADAVLSIPAILLALAIVGVLGPNLTNAMVAIGLVFTPRFFRVVRASTLAVREETYIEAARSVGTPTPRILVGEVLPNIASPLLVQLTLTMGFAMLSEASISFLGLGVQPPGGSWGTMLGRSTRFMEQAPHLVIVPGTMILLCVLAFNIMGDGLRDATGREVRR